MQDLHSNNRSLEEPILRHRYNNARNNLLLVVLFSTINLILLIADSYTYFLFSASLPYMLVDLGKFVCGMYPPDFYTGELEGFMALPQSVFWVMVVLAVFAILLYLISYLFSKNGKGGWLIFALVFFGLDTVGMFLYFQIGLDMILDVLFHVWVLVILTAGVLAHGKLKKLPPEPLPSVTASDGEFEASDAASNEMSNETADSPILRRADLAVKSRTLLAFEAMGHQIVYRRVKKVNELVIDGNVYDEYIATMERAHMLTATLSGHVFSAGFDGIGSSYGTVDGQRVAHKLRLY